MWDSGGDRQGDFVATAEDAKLILQLYQLRTEATMREARRFVGSFNPTSFDVLAALHRDSGSTNNAYWRQALSYWEMAAALVLHGALDGDLFAAANGEPFFYYAKFTPFLDEYKKTFGVPFMSQTAQVIEKVPGAKARYEGALARMRPQA
jgi:hypothetical protein